MTRRSRCCAVALALGMGMGATLPAAAAGRQDGLVICMPSHATRLAVPGARTWGIGDDRLLAPTRPAMFFRRPGERCARPASARLAG